MEKQKTTMQQENAQNQKETLIELKHIKKVLNDGHAILKDFFDMF